MKEQIPIIKHLITVLDSSTDCINKVNEVIDVAVKNLEQNKPIKILELNNLILIAIPAILAANSNILNLLSSSMALLKRNK